MIQPSEVTIQFTIPGKPIGKPRMTQRDKWKKRPCVLKYRDWADLARATFREAIERAGLPIEVATNAGNVTSLSWTATFVPAADRVRWAKRHGIDLNGTLHRQKPDRDNIDKCVLDALFGKWTSGDSGIAAGTLRKQYGAQEGLTVAIVYSVGET